MFINIFMTLTLVLAPTQIQADTNNNEAYYQIGEPSRDGIGKFYMGREISHVMGHLGAGWLERPKREREERTDLLLQNLSLKVTDHVVDLGAGTGYFSFPMALQLTSGRVLAVDIEPEMLKLIEQRKSADGVENIDVVLASERSPNIPDASVDVVLLVDAYHEFSYPREVMAGVVKGLKQGGRVILVEYRGEDSSVPIKRLHKMTQRQAKKEMSAVGLKWLRTDDYLPQQHVMVFTKI
ncbi:class I SAM-dependent methyltransferase [Brumicola pallidula]|jgi:SAM-dependent methyltransferase|uniref:23S rRNA (Adenine2085-N6)-dimethyltransferase n=1 Tax=Brumicola pallidula DSM 14239 = ACAM 615 TaxID=1121922 RepID=K6Y4V0_9ALTE|nr:class I SAM-dependent methyltransferase [Glaciecola pallidula]GAC27784.1 23S rRNA (adenine2085-N6)-dimethyltransferase [Glaciecola pallidula DSM 14239 = ACAM 615]